MKLTILLCGIATVILTLLAAWYTYQNIQKTVYICAVFSAGLGIVTLILTLLQQSEDDKEIKRVNDLLIQRTEEAAGYATGGLGNKPFMLITIHRQDDGNFNSSFQLKNFGKYPLSNIYYEITDSETLQYNCMKDLHLDRVPKLSNEQVMSINKYSQQHPEMKDINGDLPNLPKNVGRVIFNGKVQKSTPHLMYLVKLCWNNEVYFITFQYERKSEKEDFKLYNLHITDGENKQVMDAKEFFPLIPTEFWDGFNTKLDNTPSTWQGEAFK